MLYQAIFAYLHYLSIIGVFITLVIELILFKPSLTHREARVIQRTDSVYGLSALMVLVTGLLRAFYFGKGYEYYFGNNIFLLKLGLFLVVGILSIYPTIVFIKWRKFIKPGESLTVDKSRAVRVMNLIRLEVLIILFLPLLAALMSRGFGF